MAPLDSGHVRRTGAFVVTRIVAGALLCSTAWAAGIASAQQEAEPDPLAFDLDAVEVPADAPLVFANYFPPFPISIDNGPPDSDYYATEMLDPAGADGIHAAYGGFFRSRPLPRPVNPADDWDLDDMKTEVERASAAGIDGFVYDLLGIEGVHWHRLELLLEAARTVDPEFRIVLMPDISTGVMDDPDALADAVESVADDPSVYHLDDGRLVVMPYLAERVEKAQWEEWLALMGERGIDVAFVPILLEYGAIDDFDDFSYGVSVWGGRSPRTVANLPEVSADARQRGLTWMHPVALQDVRPKSAVFDEANNTETLRSMWASAAETNAEWVHLITWNDYSEATEIAPSTNTGWSPLDINAYYGAAFKTGEAPPIVRDRIYVSHRIQAVDAVPTGGQTSLMSLRSGSSPPRDQVEVLTFLRDGADVEVTVGASTYTYTAPEGVHAELFALEPGEVSVRAKADDGAVSEVTSPFEVVEQPEIQDLQYRLVSSGREGHDDARPTRRALDRAESARRFGGARCHGRRCRSRRVASVVEGVVTPDA